MTLELVEIYTDGRVYLWWGVEHPSGRVLFVWTKEQIKSKPENKLGGPTGRKSGVIISSFLLVLMAVLLGIDRDVSHSDSYWLYI